MKKLSVVFCLLLVAGCSDVRSHTVRREGGVKEAQSVSAAKIDAETSAVTEAQRDCKRVGGEAVILSQGTIYQGRLTGKMREQAEAGGPLPPFTRTHQDFKSTVVYRCE